MQQHSGVFSRVTEWLLPIQGKNAGYIADFPAKPFNSSAYIEPQTITKLPYKHEFVRNIEQKITFYGDYLCQDN
jgi:hypothetical protein